MHSEEHTQGDGKCDCLLPLSWSLLVLKERTQRGRKEERAVCLIHRVGNAGGLCIHKGFTAWGGALKYLQKGFIR